MWWTDGSGWKMCVSRPTVNRTLPVGRAWLLYVLKACDACAYTDCVVFPRNEPHLPLLPQPKLVLIYRPRRDGRLSCVRVQFHWFRYVTNQPPKANLGVINLTSLIEANALTTTPDPPTDSLYKSHTICRLYSVSVETWRATKHLNSKYT